MSDSMMNNTDLILYRTALPTHFTVVTLIITAFILLSNVFVILTLRKMGKLSLQHYYMLGLVGSDTLMLMVVVSGAIIQLRGDAWFPAWLCDMFGIASTVVCQITSLVHTAMSVDRWVSVRFPVKYRVFQANRRSHLIIISVIFGLFVFPVILSIFFTYVELLGFYWDLHLSVCLAEVGGQGIGGSMIISLFCVVVLFTIQLLANTYLLMRASKLVGANKTRMCKSIRTVITTLGVYYLCWIPTGIWPAWEMTTDSHPPIYYTYFAAQFLITNSGMSFPIYVLTLPQFRDKFLSLIHYKARVHPSPWEVWLYCKQNKLTTGMHEVKIAPTVCSMRNNVLHQWIQQQRRCFQNKTDKFTGVTVMVEQLWCQIVWKRKTLEAALLWREPAFFNGRQFNLHLWFCLLIIIHYCSFSLLVLSWTVNISTAWNDTWMVMNSLLNRISE